MLLYENFRVERSASPAWRYRALGLLLILGVAASLLTLRPGRSAGEEGPANAPVASKADTADTKVAGGPIESSTKPAKPVPMSAGTATDDVSKTAHSRQLDDTLRRARSLTEHLQLDEAIQEFGNAIRLAPSSPEAYAGRARAFALAMRYDESLKDLREAIRLAPKNQALYKQRAGVAIAMGDDDAIIADVTVVLRANPRDVEARRWREMAFVRNGDILRSFADRIDAEEIGSGSHYHGIWGKTARPKKASGVQAAAAKTEGDPYDREFRELDRIVARKSAARKMEAEASRAIESHRTDYRAYQLRGCSRALLGNYVGAIADFDVVLHAEPENVLAVCQRAAAYDMNGKADLAIAEFGRAITIAPQNGLAHYGMGCALRWKGELKKALTEFDETIKTLPSAPAYYERGAIHQDCGSYNFALADQSMAIAAIPHYENAHLRRAWLYRQLGDKQRSKQDIRDIAANLEAGSEGDAQAVAEEWLIPDK